MEFRGAEPRSVGFVAEAFLAHGVDYGVARSASDHPGPGRDGSACYLQRLVFCRTRMPSLRSSTADGEALQQVAAVVESRTAARRRDIAAFFIQKDARAPCRRGLRQDEDFLAGFSG